MKYLKIFSLFEARINTNNFNFVKHLGGSTGADLYIDNETKEYWVVKHGANIQHMYNEYITNKLYTRYGINVPESFIGEIDGEEVLVTKYLEDSVPLAYANGNIKDEVAKDFLFDAILANWDVVGINRDLDNIRVTPDGKVWRVDVGGSLLYRAMGGKKNDLFGEEASELNTLRDPNISKHASEIFKNITDKDIKKRIKDEAKKYVINNRISYVKFLKDIKNVIWDEDNQLSEEEKKEIYRKLAKRVFNLYKIFNG